MSGEATIRRGVRNGHYAAIPNHVFEDARLSMEARWLLSYLLSKPDNWTVVIGDIVRKGNCGRDKARKMIAELVETGYAEREQTRAGGKFGPTMLVIFDEPRQPGVANTYARDVSDTAELTDASDASDEAGVSEGSDGSAGADGASESVACLPQTELPSPVLPAPVKSALSNNLNLAKTDSYQGEGAREPAGDGRGAADVYDRAARRLERAQVGEQFDVWFKLWPRPGNPDFARNAWFALSAEEREACIVRTPAYLVWAAREDLTVPAVYLKARAWREMPEGLTGHRVQSHAQTHAQAQTHPHPEAHPSGRTGSNSSPHTHVIAKVCGKLWMGRRFQALLCEPTGQLVMTAFDERRIASGAISREALVWEKRRDHGWPLISKMHDLAGRNEPFKTTTAILPLVSGFQTVERRSALFAAWRRLHERRGWMFVDGLSDWIAFPAINSKELDLDAAVEAALDHFTTSLSKGRTHDAA
ncbi:helix-turn-helix domain-containing protein [Agrobacterium vitis]|uniref:helix-turn-helix domain-containing protein n=1 Tax=Allorhizobium ampelinum TaxID=3025782 RepID=UPI001F1EB49C|nr:helix-turn-helix domain-containing protein [Allorhizobium ampelinum]MCF1470747.1 helix-turn-helix domain-containing protein [Allorhizobium ampelinum]